MGHNGYSSIIKRSVPEIGTIYYSCSKFRKDCKARLIIRHGMITSEKGMHSCIEVAASAFVDVRAEMRLELQHRSVAQLSAAPAVLWQQLRDEMSQRYPVSVLQDIPRGPSVTIIKKTRKDCTGGDTLGAIQVATMRCVSSTDHRAILQFSLVHAACAGSGTNHIIGFAHPDLIRLLRYPKITLFIDGTLAIAQKPFTLCLMVMVYDAADDVYVPATYVLADSKT